MSTLACKLLNKSSINIIVINRKTQSAYHFILDYVISLLILTYSNLIGSNTTIVSQPATHYLENCEWIEFKQLASNLFFLLYFLYSIESWYKAQELFFLFTVLVLFLYCISMFSCPDIAVQSMVIFYMMMIYFKCFNYLDIPYRDL